MVNSINIFTYLSDKMANRREQRRQIDLFFENIRLENEQNEKNEEKRICQRNRLSSQLQEVLSNLSTEQFQIKTSTEEMMKDMTANFYEFLTNLMADSLSNDSVVQSSFQIPESFSQHLSNVKPKLEQLSEQISLITELIHNVSPSVSTALSELETKICYIMRFKSFLNSRAVASVQIMINICSNMCECLEHLGIYSRKINEEMSEEINKRAENPSDFDIDPVRLLSNTNNLNEVSQELAGLKQKIDEITASFSEKYSIESLFSESADFSSFFEFMRLLEPEIERITTKFSTNKKIFVKFVEDEFHFRKRFVETVYFDDREEFVGNSDDQCDYDAFNRNYEEPAGASRANLEDMLKRLK